MKARQAKIIVSVDGTANVEAWRLLFPGATSTVANGTATITVSGGGGGGDHATLTHRAWVPSLHTGTPSRFAVFDSGGAADYLALPSTGLVSWTGSAWAATTVSAPLGYSGTTLSIVQSDATHAGYLLAADWVAFNAKVAATRSIATTLPLAGGGDLSADRTLSLSGWSGTTDGQILYRSGSAFATLTVSTPLTWSGGALGIQAASGSQAGALSAANWTTFNNKEPAITATTSADYYRGDKTFQPLNKTAVGLSLVENTALSTWAGTTNITTVGTLTTGTWQATTLATGYGGTGLTGYTAGDLVYSTATNVLGKLAIGSATNLLGIVAGLPVWRSAANAKTDLSLNNVENTALSTWAGTTNITTLGTIATGVWSGTAIGETKGGTAQTTYTTGDMLYASASNTLSKLSIGSATYLLSVVAGVPTWRSPANIRTDLGLVIGTNVQAYNAQLTALAALGNGFAYQAAGVWGAAAAGDLAVSGGTTTVTQARGLRETAGPTTLTMGAVPDGNLLIRSGATVIGAAVGSVVQAYNALLLAIAGLAANGFVVRTSATTAAARTITAGSVQVSVTNGDGVSGDPTVDIEPGFWSGQYAAWAILTDGSTIYAINTTPSVNGTTYTPTGKNNLPEMVVAASTVSSLGPRTSAAICALSQGMTHRYQVVTGSDRTTVRWRIGLVVAVASYGTALKPGTAVAMVVFDSDGGQTNSATNWYLLTYDGGAGAVTYVDTGVACTVSTAYELELILTSASVSARVRLAGGTWSSTVSSSTSLPTAGTASYACALLTPTTNVARTLSVRSMTARKAY